MSMNNEELQKRLEEALALNAQLTEDLRHYTDKEKFAASPLNTNYRRLMAVDKIHLIIKDLREGYSDTKKADHMDKLFLKICNGNKTGLLDPLLAYLKDHISESI